MWIVLGNKSRARRVPEGRIVACLCKPCGRITTHVEHDVKDEIQAFLVTVFAATQRRMVCSECGEDLELEEAVRRARRAGS